MVMIADAKDKLVCAYKVGEVLVRCQTRENLRGWQIRAPQHYTPYILAHAYVEDHSLAHQKWYEPVRSPWDSVPDNTVRTFDDLVSLRIRDF